VQKYLKHDSEKCKSVCKCICWLSRTRITTHCQSWEECTITFETVQETNITTSQVFCWFQLQVEHPLFDWSRLSCYPWAFSRCNAFHMPPSSSSSRMRVIYHNWSATKQRPHPQSVAEISRHSVLSGDRIPFHSRDTCHYNNWTSTVEVRSYAAKHSGWSQDHSESIVIETVEDDDWRIWPTQHEMHTCIV